MANRKNVEKWNFKRTEMYLVFSIESRLSAVSLATTPREPTGTVHLISLRWSL